MELILPLKPDMKTPISVDIRKLVVIGSNGAGKSSFGKDLLDRYKECAEKISGMRSLFLSSEAPESSENNELSRLQSMITERLFVPRLSEYEKLMLRLQSEEFEAAVNYKEACKQNPNSTPPITKIDKIQTIWEKMFPHNRLVRKSGFIELSSAERDGDSYIAGRMSDGEKIVFYFIGAVLCARPGALLIIEEPEILLHNSIKNILWDEIEAMRPDCTFVYLTNDIDFAATRPECIRIWVKGRDADNHVWDYEVLENSESFPEELYMEILGSRKPILFIEGTDSNSIDNRLYPLIFTDYLVKPMGGCQKVIETTKAFGQLKDFHTLDSKGIVDRDRRTEGEISYLREQHIYVPDVAEVENLLMLEPVIKTVARRLMKDPEEIFEEVKKNVIQLFLKDLESQVILHARHHVRKKLEMTAGRKVSTVEELTEHVESIQYNIHVREIYDGIKSKFIKYAESEDYKSILRVYNQKGMLPQSRLCILCGISNKESYLNLIISILKENKEDAESIRTAIKESLGI
jgi:ABC-type branched-subunit amino acid transport system ATPase component